MRPRARPRTGCAVFVDALEVEIDALRRFAGGVAGSCWKSPVMTVAVALGQHVEQRALAARRARPLPGSAGRMPPSA